MKKLINSNTVRLLYCYTVLASLVFVVNPLLAQEEVPRVYSNISYDEEGRLYFQNPDTQEKYYMLDTIPPFSLQQVEQSISGSANGLAFDFKDETFEGKVVFGFINMEDGKHHQPVLFKYPAKISKGMAEVNILQLKGRYDFINWERTGKAKLGYRIIYSDGTIVYDGKVNLDGTGPFFVDTCIIEGPFINMLTHESAVISFRTNFPVLANVEVDGNKYYMLESTTNHEIVVNKLSAGTDYDYIVHCGDIQETYSFRTAPNPASRTPFTFAFASDSRAGQGGGERSLYRCNAYMLKKLTALAIQQGASFMQFTGDMITGYSDNVDDTKLQYVNWKRAIEPFAAYFPIYVGIGNHESVNYIFDDGSKYGIVIDKFPFLTSSSESVFAEMFVNPRNGPKSEDRSKYDPEKKTRNFPSYKENVYHYTYANIAMVVLNSDYWYAPIPDKVKYTSGNIHGYIMDNQLEWFKKTLEEFEKDSRIDHVFVTIHTPAFPNGGHAHDDMWYNGNNEYRPYVAGKAVDKGILERRDQFVDLMVNHSTKVAALLCGDEHNYSRTRIRQSTNIYPPDYEGVRLPFMKHLWQITNGSVGAPYYGQEHMPWRPAVKTFSTQSALCLFHIEGQKVTLEVLNPDTLEEIETIELK